MNAVLRLVLPIFAMMASMMATIRAAADDLESSVSLANADSSGDSSLQFQGLLGSETLQYPTPVDNRSEFSSNQLLRAQVKFQKDQGTAFLSADLKSAKSLNLDYQYLTVNEMYAGDNRKTEGFFLGRKKESWNQGDTDWNLGLWQPLFQEDGVRQYQQGLTGLFYRKTFDNFEIVALGSPFCIPTTNADLVEKNGTLVSENRWMRSLPERATVNGRDVLLSYRLKSPSLTELLTKPTLAAKILWGKVEQGTWASFSIGRKPMNALSIKYDAALVSRSVGLEGQAEVVPVVHMHNIVSADVGIDLLDMKLSASLLADEPEILPVENSISGEGFQTDYYQQQPKSFQGLTLKANGVYEFLSRNVNWTLGYLKAQTEKTSDVDSSGKQQSEFIPYRLIFTNAVSIQGQIDFSDTWMTRLKYLRDFDQSGSLWSAEAHYHTNQKWNVFAGLDVLGVDKVSQIEIDNRFLNSYRHNDRFYGGFAYVF